MSTRHFTQSEQIQIIRRFSEQMLEEQPNSILAQTTHAEAVSVSEGRDNALQEAARWTQIFADAGEWLEECAISNEKYTCKFK
jgi:hypothetical protein